MWNSAYERLERFVEEHGHAQVPTRHRDDDGFTLCAWVGEKRRKFGAGRLNEAPAARLGELSGWVWTPPVGRRPEEDGNRTRP